MSEETHVVRRPRLTFVWIQFGPYLMDRCEAAALELPNYDVVGVEIASKSTSHYAWAPQGNGENFTKITLFPDDTYDRTGWLKQTWLLIKGVVGIGAKHNFLCHYNMSSVFVLAVILRFLGRRVFVMNDSKFDDRPRYLWREILKWFFLLPYNGALVGGRRHQEYLSFLGFQGRPVVEGFDTVSMARLRTLAEVPPAPEGTPFAKRCFITVARLIAKKNLPLVIAAYQLYRSKAGIDARELTILSSGELAEALKADVQMRNLLGVTFTSFVPDADMSRHLGDALALIMPSIEEQWGVAVNEALFLGVPILCSENVGARDGLVRNGLNGYVFNPDDAAGLAHWMEELASNETRWRSMATSSLVLAPSGDVSHFGTGIRSLIEAVP